MKAAQLDQVFAALASPARRRMLDLLLDAPGTSVKALAEHFQMSRVAVLKHVQVLEAAGLLLSHKAGRVRHLYVNLVPIQMIHDRWSSDYGQFWASRMVDLKSRVEGRVASTLDQPRKKKARRA